MSVASQDLRYAIRTLFSRPSFTAAVVATLALGIGASTAMFSLVDAALLRRLPFADQERIVVLWGVAGPERDIRGASLPEAHDWATMNHTLERVSIYDETSLTLRTPEGAERVDAELVSADFFRVLGVRAAHGRTFLPEEDAAPEAHPAVVLSDAIWTQRFGADPTLVGRSITLNDRPFTVVGVMPEGFRGLSFDTDVWFPAAMLAVASPASLREDRGSRWAMVLGRLAPGRTADDAQRDLDAVAGRLTTAYPETNTGRGVRVMSLTENYLGDTEGLLRTLFGAVLLFLLITCANVTSLQLVRASARRREIAVRLALGADRGRLVRQLLTEGVVLAVIGGTAGALLATWGVVAARSWIPEGLLPRYVEVGVDVRALAFGMALSITVGVVCGLVPALLGSRQELTESLKEGARNAVSGLGRIRRLGPQQLLVVAEVALALVLLAGAGLMLRSLQRQLAVSPGFRAEGVLAARVTLPPRYAPEQRVAFVEQLTQRLAATPGVGATAVTSDLPLRGNTSASRFVVDGGDPEGIRFYRHIVQPAFFPTLGVPIVAGRNFTTDDRRDTPAVIVVGQAMAKRLWGGANAAIGKRIRLGGAQGPEVTVVGVAGDARFRDLSTNLEAPGSEPDVYFPFGQRTDRDLDIAIRSKTSVVPPVATVREAVAEIDPLLSVYAARPLSDALHRQSATVRFGSLVLGAFSAIAVLLAAIGIYGVVAFVVSLSRREIAIRIALGATGESVSALIVRNGLALVAAGVALGLVGATFGTRLLASQLFGVSPTDPLTFVAVAALLVLVAAVATYLPAHQAAGMQPQTVLKGE